jgi:hypothetical protein
VGRLAKPRGGWQQDYQSPRNGTCSISAGGSLAHRRIRRLPARVDCFRITYSL